MFTIDMVDFNLILIFLSTSIFSRKRYYYVQGRNCFYLKMRLSIYLVTYSTRKRLFSWSYKKTFNLRLQGKEKGEIGNSIHSIYPLIFWRNKNCLYTYNSKSLLIIIKVFIFGFFQINLKQSKKRHSFTLRKGTRLKSFALSTHLPRQK